jgi:hypothetical protein
MSGLVRRTTQPDVREKQAFTGRSAAKDRLLGAAQRRPGLLARVMPIGGQVEPSAQLKAVPTGSKPGASLSYLSPMMRAGGQHHGRRSLACLFEYMF